MSYWLVVYSYPHVLQLSKKNQRLWKLLSNLGSKPKLHSRRLKLLNNKLKLLNNKLKLLNSKPKLHNSKLKLSNPGSKLKLKRKNAPLRMT